MCTVTIVPLADTGGLRLVSSRDEQRTRPASSWPVRVRLGTLDAVMPIDPRGGGTWIGVNSAGVAATLLNATGPGWPATGARSRGEIVPWVLRAASLDEALDRAANLSTADLAAFTLVLCGAGPAGPRAGVVRWRGASLDVQPIVAVRGPLLWASSGLGDHLVAGPRAELWSQMLAAGRDPADVQRRFHDHRWPAAPHLSVRMSRTDARTVSRTSVDLHPSGPHTMAFEPVADDAPEAAPAAQATLKVGP